MTQRFYIEIAPMGEAHYTGIAQVAAAICEQALGDPDEPRFMVGRSLVDRRVVEKLVATRDGALLNWALSRMPSRLAPLLDHFGSSVGLFTNRKYLQRTFDVEMQFVHDLSTVVTPHYHTRDTVEFHKASFRDDIPTNDLTICDSDATAADVCSYMPNVDPGRVRTIPLSYHFDAQSLRLVDEVRSEGRDTEPYVVVLGTLEPRKNVRAVLEMLARAPALLKAARFVFVGRFGWGSPMMAAVEELGLAEALRDGRIVVTGFLSEPGKNVLLHQAALVLYPSFFEGFGLPVLEALAAGVPVVTTRSSSIPEAGGRAAFYFDPMVPGDLDRAVFAALFDRDARQLRVRLGHEWAGEFNWATTWSLLKDWAAECREAPGLASSGRDALRRQELGR